MMKASNRLRLAVVACAVALCGAAALATGPDPSAGACFTAAFNAGDADAIAACYAEDAILWFPSGPMVRGRQAIHDGFAGYFDGTSARNIELTELGHEAMGDTRVAWGTFVVRMTDKASGKEMVEHGRYTDVSKRIGGRWQYVVDHPSDDPVPPEQPAPPPPPQ